MSPHITIRGARVHNLKNIDLTLPRNALVVVTGLSGSGKSSLAFDTLYAEGQRRYVESLSTYARQFLERLEKPDVDLIDGLSPAIAIEQKTAAHNPRSTVGTVTEIYDYLRLMYARVGTPYCPDCTLPIAARSLDQLIDDVMGLPSGIRILILSPVSDRDVDTGDLVKKLRKEGFARVKIDNQVQELDALPRIPKSHRSRVQVVIDRLVVKDTIRNRLADSLELALARSDGQVVVDILPQAAPDEDVQLEPMVFSEQARCPACGKGFPELHPALFSFNAPQGACLRCDGLGSTSELDPELIVPNPELSLREGAVDPWSHRNTVHFSEFLESLTTYYGTDIYTPFRSLPEPFQQVLLYGSGKQKIPFRFDRGDGRTATERKPFEGVIPNLKRRLRDSGSAAIRESISKYLSFRACPDCGGSRLNPFSRAVRFGGKTICELTALPIDHCLQFLSTVEKSGQRADIAERLIKEIVQRLGFLKDVGLGYLTLDRQASTLSGGESQRIRLATQIGAKLTGVLYVLDEPSIGLHPRDNRRLLDSLVRMRDLGNSVLVVEHDAETIRMADHVVELGPGAGVAGGHVVFSGSPRDLIDCRESLTGRYLSGRLSIPVPRRRRGRPAEVVTISGASANNLKAIDVFFPLRQLICVTGVSGSGKSTLVIETLYKALCQHLHHARVVAGTHSAVDGLEHIDKVINIDQSPIGRTPRSNPGTYSGVLGDIRDLFSRTPEARMRGYRAGRFSFNVKGGRCEACGGDGVLKIEMHFLPDVYVTCDVCHGRRYNRETLEVRYKGKTIADVLDFTVNQALDFFGRIKGLRSKLEILKAVGLGYIRLGQPGTTLSGGEAQRLKLSRELSRRSTGRTLIILDEPTTGLHVDDVSRLLTVLNQLVDSGNTVIVIEHQLDVIKSADWVVDLGPEGGEGGGQVVAVGTPETVASNPLSYTGRYLREILGR